MINNFFMVMKPVRLFTWWKVITVACRHLRCSGVSLISQMRRRPWAWDLKFPVIMIAVAFTIPQSREQQRRFAAEIGSQVVHRRERNLTTIPPVDTDNESSERVNMIRMQMIWLLQFLSLPFSPTNKYLGSTFRCVVFIYLFN